MLFQEAMSELTRKFGQNVLDATKRAMFVFKDKNDVKGNSHNNV